MYELFIANKNYSSWSLRPWVLMKTLKIPFVERLAPFPPTAPGNTVFKKFSPSGKVPFLKDGKTGVWDSFAIAEYLAERHKDVWPADAKARGFARSAAAEMHSGFTDLRNTCTMSCGIRVKLAKVSPELKADVSRIAALWNDGLKRFGGPFLAGKTFTAADAFYCPVAFRVQTYGLKLDAKSSAYAKRLLAMPAMREWYQAALNETMRIERYEEHARSVGKVTEDLRAA
jgi:glutathione S-transferase